MSAKTKKTAPKGKRYTDTEKQAIVDYVNQVNAKAGRGGQAAAVKKFGVTALTISGWLKGAAPAKAAPAAPAKAPAPKAAAKAPAPAPKAAAKAPAPAPKAAAKAPAPKAPVKPIKRKKAPQGTRYTDEQKKAVLDYVAAVNEQKGRGGMSAAARKFKITPLTVSAWITKFGGGKSEGKGTAKLLAKLAKAEAIIASIKAKLGAK